MTFRINLLCLFLTMLLSACGNEQPAPESESDPTAPDQEQEIPSLCAETPDIDDYTPNLVKTGEHFTLTLVTASPTPWDVGDNLWTIKIAESAGEPRDDATIRITPYMPDHGHGVSPPNYAGHPQGNDGLYDIDTFNLIMPGFWELTAEIDAPGVDPESIVFRICVEG